MDGIYLVVEAHPDRDILGAYLTEESAIAASKEFGGYVHYLLIQD